MAAGLLFWNLAIRAWLAEARQSMPHHEPPLKLCRAITSHHFEARCFLAPGFSFWNFTYIRKVGCVFSDEAALNETEITAHRFCGLSCVSP